MKFLIAFVFILLPALGNSRDYSKDPQAIKFANHMAYKYHFKKGYILQLLKKAHHQPKTLARYQGRYKVGNTDFSWDRYKNKILIPQSIQLGKEFMHKYQYALKKASKIYNVSPEIITAFIRVESKFGMYGNEYSVWDSLVTLAFNKNRMQKYFRSELEKLLILSKKEKLNILKLRGSFAGAMGCVQQMPSIQLRYGVDLDGDGKKNPNSMVDCIGSIANFLHRHKWSNRRQTITKALYKGKRFTKLKTSYKSYYKLSTLKRYGVIPKGNWRDFGAYLVKLKSKNKDELYLGDKNYRIITTYNHSSRYAVTIALYAKALRN